MKKNIISAKQAVELIKTGKFDSTFEIEFNKNMINPIDAILLGKKGINVPEELIEYEDDKIDYSDIPPLTDRELVKAQMNFTFNAEIHLEKEVTDWIKKENINLSEFAAKLIRSFYYGIKSLPKNAAV